MSTFTNSPRLLKGALVGLDLFNPIPSVIAFQYNPETLTRSLKARAMFGEGAKAEAMRLTGAPEEDITLDVEIDATDQLENAEDTAVSMCIYPQLSALEMLLSIRSVIVHLNKVKMCIENTTFEAMR